MILSAHKQLYEISPWFFRSARRVEVRVLVVRDMLYFITVALNLDRFDGTLNRLIKDGIDARKRYKNTFSWEAEIYGPT